jgi:hypothetical protein
VCGERPPLVLSVPHPVLIGHAASLSQVCGERAPIYPFDEPNVEPCGGCGALCHARCVAALAAGAGVGQLPRGCGRCERIGALSASKFRGAGGGR